MKKIFLAVGILLSLVSSSQNVKQDVKGNYITISRKDSSSAKPTGKTFTDAKGNIYPVMISKNGKLFVVRTSKTGNKYNYYLKL